MMTDEELAKVSRGQAIDLTDDGTEVDPLLSLMAEVATQVTRIADNTGKPTLELTAADAEKAWETTGMRMYADRFIEALKALGIKVLDE